MNAHFQNRYTSANTGNSNRSGCDNKQCLGSLLKREGRKCKMGRLILMVFSLGLSILRSSRHVTVASRQSQSLPHTIDQELPE